jgi:CBS-domain-containing membrane protein
MKAADIMVSNVITVTPEHSVRDVSQLLLTHRISGVPVLDSAGNLVGIVTESDLMRRAETGTEHNRSWWLRLLMGRDGLAGEYVKEHSRRVADVMTVDVISAAPDTPIRDVAELLERYGIKRVPVVKDRKLVGLISRANLLEMLTRPEKQAAAVSDAALHDAVMATFKAEPWMHTAYVNVAVQDGTVELNGIVATRAEKQALRVAAEETAGVRAVRDNIVIRPIPAHV